MLGEEELEAIHLNRHLAAALHFCGFVRVFDILLGRTLGNDLATRLAALGIYGAIIGRAYYTGAISLRDAIDVAK